MQKIIKRSMRWSCGLLIFVLAAFLLAGCQSNNEQPAAKASAAPAPAVAKPAAPSPAPAVATPVPAAPPKPAPARVAVRIKAGAIAPYTDSSGNVWLPDQGFADGDTTERDSSMQIANTKDPAIYRTEHYSMTSFSYKLPNGKYTVKLHFAETYEGITGAGQRVFSYNVAGHEFKDFDVWAKTGGSQRAYVETVNAEVTNGKLDITFTSNVENPEINGIEIIPAS